MPVNRSPVLWRSGMLFTDDVGKTLVGGRLSFRQLSPAFLRAYLRGSWRLRTPFNDIVPRNMGANGLVFDPSIDWVTQMIAGGTVSGGPVVFYIIYMD